ncbi:YeeE/YedE family protein [Zooshikella sp. RANM57]|uniref:YeeE/YedE family protein n=1 Tax=Zooshikella sp. RANM57 TaxID=3425863 RepID=UPI003D6F43AF
MTSFTPISSLIGGVAIGLSAFLLLWLSGRIAGISGIVNGAVKFKESDLSWRWLFILGIVLGAFVASKLGFSLPTDLSLSWVAVLSGGFLVGVGTQLGSGCTSGHGICGIGRGSVRSITATLLFMATAGLVVFVTRHVLL